MTFCWDESCDAAAELSVDRLFGAQAPTLPTYIMSNLVTHQDYVDFDPLSAEASSPEEREAAKRFWDSIQLYTHRERGEIVHS